MANMVRGIDELGRVVIPSEIRKQLGWVQGTRLEIIPADAGVMVRAQDFGSAADHARRLQALVGDEDPDLAELLSEVVARLEVSECGERI